MRHTQQTSVRLDYSELLAVAAISRITSVLAHGFRYTCIR